MVFTDPSLQAFVNLLRDFGKPRLRLGNLTAKSNRTESHPRDTNNLLFAQSPAPLKGASARTRLLENGRGRAHLVDAHRESVRCALFMPTGFPEKRRHLLAESVQFLARFLGGVVTLRALHRANRYLKLGNTTRNATQIREYTTMAAHSQSPPGQARRARNTKKRPRKTKKCAKCTRGASYGASAVKRTRFSNAKRT